MAKTILLADDSVTIQKVVELTFMGQGYEVTAVNDGTSALAKLAEARPDIVVADVHMPGANGYEVAVQSKQRYSDMPVLLLVGTFEPFDEQKMAECGADAFLKKPFDSQDLMKQVEQLIAAASASGTSPYREETQPLDTFESPEPMGMGSPAGFPPAKPAPSDFGRAPSSDDPFGDMSFPDDTTEDLPPLTLEELEAEPEVAIEESSGFEAVSLDPPAMAPPTAEAALPEMPASPPPAPSFEMASPAFESQPEVELPADLLQSPDSDDTEPTTTPTAVPPAIDSPLPPIQTAPETLPDPVAVVEPTPPVSSQSMTFEAPPVELAAPETAAPQILAAEPEPEIQAAAPAPEASVAAPETPQPTTEVAASPTNGSGFTLNDQDIERIARRVAEIIGDNSVRAVAWEVVPDLAEVIIRERIRELESQVE